MSIFKRGESAPKARPNIIVTDAGAADGSKSKVTDLETGRSVTVDNTVAAVAAASQKLNRR